MDALDIIRKHAEEADIDFLRERCRLSCTPSWMPTSVSRLAL
jgi:hypothetical protein